MKRENVLVREILCFKKFAFFSHFSLHRWAEAAQYSSLLLTGLIQFEYDKSIFTISCPENAEGLCDAPSQLLQPLVANVSGQVELFFWSAFLLRQLLVIHYHDCEMVFTVPITSVDKITSASQWGRYRIFGESIFLDSCLFKYLRHPKHTGGLLLVDTAGIWPFSKAFKPPFQ